MRKFSQLFVQLLILIASISVYGSATSSQSGFNRVYISDAFKSTYPENFIPKTDLLDFEIQRMDAFIKKAGKGSKLIIDRYGITSEQVADLAIAAKNKGIEVQIITDLNQVVDFEFKTGEFYRADFANGILNKNPKGNLIKKLLDNGFKYNDSQAGIFSQPVYNKSLNDMPPIYHQKASLFKIDPSDKAKDVLYYGTNNLTINDRYNRLYEVTNNDLTEYYGKQVENTIKAFKHGKEIKEIDEIAPLRVKLSNGAFHEMAFSQGKYNVNDRIVELLEQATKNPSKYKVDEIVLSHFAYTNTKFTEALENYSKINPNLKVFGIFDNQFSQLYGYGKSPYLKGYDIFNPFGRMYPSPGEMNPNWELYVYQSPGLDRDGKRLIQTALEGAPENVRVWHDKTSLLSGTEDGKKVYNVYTGSFNLSNHAENAEVQSWIHTEGADDIFYNGTKESIVNVVKSQPLYALPIDIATSRNLLARLTGLAPLEVPTYSAKRVIVALKNNDSKAILNILNNLQKSSTTLVNRIPIEEVTKNIKVFDQFLKFFNQSLAGKKPTIYDLKRIASLAELVAQKNPSAVQLEIVLNKIFKNIEGKTWEQKKSLVQNAWKLIEKNNFLPPSQSPKLRTMIFDWDDTVAYLPTKIGIIEKASGKTITLGTREYAALERKLGVTKMKEIYNMNKTADFDPFAGFREGTNGKNLMLDDMMSALKENPEGWKGPAFDAWKNALEDTETAKSVIFLSARGHSREEVMEVFKELQKQRQIKNLPLLENIYPTTNPSLNPENLSVSEIKSKIINSKINDLRQLSKDGYNVELTFLDDNDNNVNYAIKTIKQNLKDSKIGLKRMSINVEKVSDTEKWELTQVLKAKEESKKATATDKLLSGKPQTKPSLGSDCNVIQTVIGDILQP